jgi:hypothetical protein
MTWRLVCEECVRTLGDEIRSISIFQHADVRCAHCGVFIRSSLFDKSGKWSPITEEQRARLSSREMENPDDRLHCGFALDEDEADLGAAQDAICKEKSVRCKIFECDPKATEGACVVQVYMRSDTLSPIDDKWGPAGCYAGAIWRHDRLPSDADIMLALKRWRGPEAPKFVLEWYKEEPE